MRKRTHILALIMVFAWALCGCVSVHMGEVVKRGEPTVKRVEMVTRIKDIVIQPSVGADGIHVTVSGMAEASVVDKYNVVETKTEKRMFVGVFPGLVPESYGYAKKNGRSVPDWYEDTLSCCIFYPYLCPIINAITVGVPTFDSLFYDPWCGKYTRLQETSIYKVWGFVGTYKFLRDPVSNNIELPSVIIQKSVLQRTPLSNVGTEFVVGVLDYKDTQLSDRQGGIAFVVRSGGSHYVDVELSLKDVTASPYAKLLEAVGSKSQKFRMQLSRVGSVPLKVPDWPLESIAVIGSAPDAALAAKVNDALADIRYFNLSATTEMEMALQERLIDRTKLFDDSALMQRVCQTAKSDLLIVLKPTGGAAERTIVAKLVRVKTGEVIASAEANGAEDVRVVAEVLCRAYAVAKK